jgi:hypothetical protein
VLANGIALYGGRDITVSGNLVADTLTEGGGLHLGNRFDAVPASGTILFDSNIIIRSGSIDPRWHFGVGALWFYALDAPITADVRVRDTVLVDSTDEAIQFLGKPIREIWLERLAMLGAGGPALQIQSSGVAHLRGSRAVDMGQPAIRRCDRAFRLDSFGNRGLSGENAVGCPSGSLGANAPGR